jgi:lipopolysaccharide biosynthesis glycosyltransferase
MQNALIYSMHIEEKKIEDNYSFEQLKLSISTLRKYNKTLKVFVYISPKGILKDYKKNIDETNVEFIEYDAEYDKRLNHRIYAIWTSHKWTNTFHALRTKNLDNVLYIDSDVIFQKDPSYIFDKYGNTEIIYGKPDVSDTWFKVFNVRNGGMNDGVFLINKKALKYEKGLLKYRNDYVYNLQEKFKNETDTNISVLGIQWVACQYAMSEYMLDQNNPIKFFENDDVYIVGTLSAFQELSIEKQSNIALLHYLSYNMHHFAPEAYKIYERARGRG